MDCNNRYSDNGFTLIEILLVMAILGVLSAIAIPQFSEYRQRAFDAAALSDIKQMSNLQEALMTDQHSYGMTTDTGAAVAALGLGTVLQGVTSATDGLAELHQFIPLGVSRSVHLISNSGGDGSHYLLMAKHSSGNRIFGIDHDADGVFSYEGLPGVSLAGSGVIIPSVPNSLDLTAALGWSRF